MSNLGQARTDESTFAPDALGAHFLRSINQAERFEEPYRHWMVHDLLPNALARELPGLNFPIGDLGGISGKRELHNDTRHYFDATNNANIPVCGAVANMLQSEKIVHGIEAATGADLRGTFVRIEYAQDVAGFWLQPHTDLGVKKFTLLYYFCDESATGDLGTDIYADAKTWAKRAPFQHGSALIFVPNDHTWHGFEPRNFDGVRRSLIINYVTTEWRARDQLAFPNTPVYSEARSSHKAARLAVIGVDKR